MNNDYFDALGETGQAIDLYLARYNDSEHNAWLTGPSLANYVNSAIPTGYARNIVAHSMGNVVAGSALQNGMKIDNYALLHAAIPAACYDTGTNLQPSPSTTSGTVAGQVFTIHEWDVSTPDDDPDSVTQNLSYRGRLAGVSGNLVNFYLAQDYATSYAWEVNNVLAKPPNFPVAGTDPEDGILNEGFSYLRTNPSGMKLLKGDGDLGSSVITNRDEANAFACRTWAKVVGAEGRTAGPITSGSNTNLGSSTFSPSGSPGGASGFGTAHSAEFDWNIQVLEPFYNTLLDELRIPRNQ